MAKYDLISNSRIGPDVPSAPDVAHDHMPSMPLDPSLTAIAQGHVEGAWSITALGAEWTPDEVFLLPEGSTMKVEHGTAIRVQSADGWHHCEFPEAGMLHGPVVWTTAEAACEKKLLSQQRNDYMQWNLKTQIAPISAVCLASLLVLRAFGGMEVSGGLLKEALYIMMFGGAPLLSLGGVYLCSIVLEKLGLHTVHGMNYRLSKVLRMPRSGLRALNIPQPHLDLVAPEPPQDDLDLEIQAHLVSYHAQRAKLAAKSIPGSPMMEHTFAMLREISLRMEADRSALRDDGLRQTYLELIQRAEADVTLVLEKKDAATAEALVGDMTALLKQMDRHKA